MDAPACLKALQTIQAADEDIQTFYLVWAITAVLDEEVKKRFLILLETMWCVTLISIIFGIIPPVPN
jgi:hypothetical protein